MRDDTSGALIEASPVAPTVLQFARDEKRWTGTADELLSRLNQIVDIADRPKGWPGTARALGDALRRIAPPAYTAGVSLEFKRSNGSRLWTLRTFDSAADSADAVPIVTNAEPFGTPIGTASIPSHSLEPANSADSAADQPPSSVQTKEREEKQEEKTGEKAEVERGANHAALSAPAAPAAHHQDPMVPINVARRTAHSRKEPTS